LAAKAFAMVPTIRDVSFDAISLIAEGSSQKKLGIFLPFLTETSTESQKRARQTTCQRKVLILLSAVTTSD
jgi:hypothetical protein